MDKQRVMNLATVPVRAARATRPGSTTTRVAVACLIFLLFGIAMSPIPAAWAETRCVVPDDLALRDIALPAARQAVKADQRLVVLTFGGIQTTGAASAPNGDTYPGRLAAELSAALPNIQVTVSNEPPPGKTSVDVPAALPGLIAKTGARLVIWGPVSRDVAAHLDQGVFLTSVTSGIDAVRRAGADIILLDATFIPLPARMALIEAYREKLRSAADSRHVPLLRRHDLMRLWAEDGTLNLAARDQAEQDLVARRLFACVARSLALPVAAAVR